MQVTEGGFWDTTKWAYDVGIRFGLLTRCSSDQMLALAAKAVFRVWWTPGSLRRDKNVLPVVGFVFLPHLEKEPEIGN